MVLEKGGNMSIAAAPPTDCNPWALSRVSTPFVLLSGRGGSITMRAVRHPRTSRRLPLPAHFARQFT